MNGRAHLAANFHYKCKIWVWENDSSHESKKSIQNCYLLDCSSFPRHLEWKLPESTENRNGNIMSAFEPFPSHTKLVFSIPLSTFDKFNLLHSKFDSTVNLVYDNIFSKSYYSISISILYLSTLTNKWTVEILRTIQFCIHSTVFMPHGFSCLLTSIGNA